MDPENPVVPTEVSIEAPNSEENGNVPAEEVAPIAPSEPAPVETPVETPVTEPELFELPDGRKVDAATLSKEFKENFLPEFTRKSQELAALKTNPGDTPVLPEPPKSKYEDPNYVPQNYEELLRVAEERGAQRALQTLEEKEAERANQTKAIEDAVVAQLDEVKKTDPNVNENALFLHATKYGFRDLRQAHVNMKDMAEQAKKIQQQTEQNILKRNDPVSIKPNANGAPLNPAHFASAVEYLRALKASGQ